MLPPGVVFVCLHSAAVSADGEWLRLFVLTSTERLCAIDFPVAELEQRAAMIADSERVPSGAAMLQ